MSNFLRVLEATALRVLQETASELSNSTLIGPTPNEGDKTVTDPEDDGDGFFMITLEIIWYIIVFAFFAGIIGGIAYGIYYLISAYQMRKKSQQFSDDPEAQIKHQELGFLEKARLKKWAINDTGFTHIPAVDVERVQIQTEDFFKIKFGQNVGETKTIIANHTLEKNKETVYFEVEIEQLDNGIEVVIGLVDKDKHKPEVLPGLTTESVGFSSKGGKVFLNTKEKFSSPISGEFGDTFGIGYTFETGNFWFFHNGRFLNEPTHDSVNKQKDPYEYKNQVNNKEKMKEIKKDVDSRQVIGVKNATDYLPAIGATGPCRLILNIGGGMFRNFNKEIAKGLL